MNGRIERSGYMEVIQAEIATNRVQGEDETTKPEPRSVALGATVIVGWMVYVFAIGYGVLWAIGALRHP